MSKRFVYGHSHVYGWTVYDTKQGHSPAFEACSDLLSPVKVEEDGTVVVESPILLNNEYAAMRLCMKLNAANKKIEKF